MKRAGFTMIELIFVIVILGILAAVAIPKLAATRDDAEFSKMLANTGTCINDIGAAYTATGSDINATSLSSNTACVAANGHDDATISVASGTSITVVIDNVVSDLEGTHDFGGTNVTY
ncbi:type II secretion system protein [Sulfurimonas sp.]|uniref:pilin n=1 Tax=Sulfurimonas sp. TaxID=2022749 RepID=UPI0025F0CF7F|nr:type II secretion system protein [Sulfurimonas sp.]